MTLLRQGAIPASVKHSFSATKQRIFEHRSNILLNIIHEVFFLDSTKKVKKQLARIRQQLSFLKL
jgi:hypothetical protein